MIYRYITKRTFDSCLYQTIEKKQTFISQTFTSKTPQRTMELRLDSNEQDAADVGEKEAADIKQRKAVCR